MVLFKCSSLYTIFTAAVLCELYYKDEKTILVLSSQSNNIMKQFFDNFQKTKEFFDEIIILNEASIDKKDIEERVAEILHKYKIDIFHMFMYDTYSLFFQKMLPLDTKIIYTEEGSMIYQPKKSYDAASKTIFFCNRLSNIISMDWERINEVNLYAVEAFDRSIDVPVKKIEIEKLINDKIRMGEFLRKINFFFNYCPQEEDYNIVFFDSNLCQIGYIQSDFERRILKYLLKIIGDEKYIIKLHPHEENDFYKFRYCNKQVNIQKESKLPWEIIFLNKMYKNPMQKLVIMACASTAEYNSIILGKQCFPNIKFISLIDITKPYMTEKHKIAEQLYDNTKKIYALLEPGKGYIPTSFLQLQHIMDDIFHRKNRKSIFNEEKEIEWLRKRCVQKGEFLHSTIEETELYIKDENNVDMNETTVYDYTDDIIEINFSFLDEIKISEWNFEWVVYKSVACKKLIIDKVYTIDKSNLEENDLSYNIINILPDNSILLDNNIIKGTLYLEKPIYNICIKFRRDDVKISNGWLKDTTLDTRNQAYYDLLYQWLNLKQKNIKFSDFFDNKKYSKVGIYGYGRIGQLLYKEIEDMDIEIHFIQKEGTYAINDGVKVISIKEIAEERKKFDVIIITPIYDVIKIKSELEGHYNGKIMIIDELLKSLEK